MYHRLKLLKAELEPTKPNCDKEKDNYSLLHIHYLFSKHFIKSCYEKWHVKMSL